MTNSASLAAPQSPTKEKSRASGPYEKYRGGAGQSLPLAPAAAGFSRGPSSRAAPSAARTRASAPPSQVMHWRTRKPPLARSAAWDDRLAGPRTWASDERSAAAHTGARDGSPAAARSAPRGPESRLWSRHPPRGWRRSRPEPPSGPRSRPAVQHSTPRCSRPAQEQRRGGSCAMPRRIGGIASNRREIEGKKSAGRFLLKMGRVRL